MDLDPKLLKELTETFKTELDEQLQVITDELLFLEHSNHKNEDSLPKIDRIFRASHNIKGAARGIGVINVGEIAHHVESLFSLIKKNEVELSADIINLCLEAVDAMRHSMKAYIENIPLSFDLNNLTARLASGSSVKTEVKNNFHYNPLQNETTIRVSLGQLDQVSALMEEVQVNKIAIDEYYTELTRLNVRMKRLADLWKKTESTIQIRLGNELEDNLNKLLDLHADNLAEVTHTTNQLYKNMRPRMNELTTLTDHLQSEVRMLRLIPASELLRIFPRLIRDIASELNKKVEVIIKGEDVKMDKLVLERLKDPLTHILRNAIDHAIESPEIRKAQGKDEIGRIAIEITEEGNQILMTVSDDGQGMDIQKILSVAESKNLIPKSRLELMNDNDILELIFLPGFSTREIVTSVSGRGVGLDIVKENLNALKGSVTLKSKLNKGTTFYLRVPLTLASERGLMLSCGGQLFAIPTSTIERVLILNSAEIISVSASEAIMLDKHPVPLRSLADILNLKNTGISTNDRYCVVVVKKDNQNAALLVDEIIGEREIIIKPLQPPLTNVPFVAGGTLSGSGQAILVLNSTDILHDALQTKKSSRVSLKKEDKKPQARPHILVVDDSITTRTMEKNVLESKNYEVTLAVNGKEAWDILQKRKFSLLITDVSMPIMDGCTLTERVKNSPELHNLPVIIVTSMDSAADKKRGIEAGANAYIVKSEFESDSLLKMVEQLV